MICFLPTTIFLSWRWNCKWNSIPVPSIENAAHIFLLWFICGTWGCNFIPRAQLSKWLDLYPWLALTGIHVTIDLQPYLSFVHYIPKQMEFHGQWIMKPSLSKELNMIVATSLKKRQGRDKLESWIHSPVLSPIILESSQEPHVGFGMYLFLW